MLTIDNYWNTSAKVLLEKCGISVWSTLLKRHRERVMNAYFCPHLVLNNRILINLCAQKINLIEITNN